MVWPDRLVTTSPGLTARPLGMFSQVGMMPTTLTFGLQFADRAQRAQHAGRAAHVELHLVHLGAGLSEMPPRVEGDALAHQHHRRLAPWRAPWYCMTMKRGGSSEPWATARNEPMPSFSICLRSNTSTLKPNCLPSFLASAARKLGVAVVAGPVGALARQRHAGRHRLALPQARGHGDGLRLGAPAATRWPAWAPPARWAWCGGTDRPRRPPRPPALRHAPPSGPRRRQLATARSARRRAP